MEQIQLKVEKVVEERPLYKNVSVGYKVTKRLFDIIASLTGIILLLPVFIIIAAAILIESPGPVIFVQRRCGLKGRAFDLYKFRSMVKNAQQLQPEIEDRNEIEGPMFKIKNDPRVTKVGKLIRKTSIDELPQLFNVLKGDMSLVGPRPPIVAEVEEYKNWQTLRLSVKPGLTGLWQVSGRNGLSFEEMVRLDLKYIRERSFLYDLRIILRTFPVLLGDKDAF